MSKQLRLYKEKEEGGISCGPRAWGHRQGIAKPRPEASGEVGGSRQSPSCSLETLLRMAAEDPQKAIATIWRLQEHPQELQSPIFLGQAARPQACG